MPIAVAPTAMQAMAHCDAELGIARACSNLNVTMGLSSQSTKSIEDVFNSAPSGNFIFQLYVYKDRTITLGLVKRAEKCGFKAVAVTVDRPILGKREKDIRNKFTLPSYLTLANFAPFNAITSDISNTDTTNLQPVRDQIDDSIDWSFITWLRQITHLKIVIKGVLTVEDATLAVMYGVDAVWVSNHGGRQLDSTPATIEVLPDIRRSVNAACKRFGRTVQVFIDGGVMRGTDVLKVQHKNISISKSVNDFYGRRWRWERMW